VLATGLRKLPFDEWLRVVWPKARATLGGPAYPVQSDHVRIEEHELRAWAAPAFRLERRVWPGKYLTVEFIRAT
jgi:hypothetical protein